MKTSLKASLIATAIASLPFGADAAGLGQINILSGLGQPLQAEIQLNASAHELQSLTARIPSPDAFRQANVPYSQMMTGLRVSVESRGTRSVVKISSERPVNEPFVDMLVELNWAAGRMIREYTMLLDPVDVGAARVAGAPDVAAPATAAAMPPAAAPAPAQPSSGVATADSYEVKRGDTLRRIAEAHRPAEVSLDQMLVALFRENRDSFDGGNMNRLRAGTVLSVPDAAAAAAVTEAEARKEILAQAADFGAYRRRLAATVAEHAASDTEPSSQASGGRIVPKVTDAMPAASQGDQVRVSRTADTVAAGDQTARLQSLEEELTARDRALAEANDRVATLERNIRELQKLMELKSQNLAQMQQQAGSTAAAEPQETAAVAPAVVANEPTAEAPKSEPQAAVEPAAAVPPQPDPKPAAKPAPKAVKAPESAAEPDFLDTLLQDPTLLAGGGGIVVLLLAFAGYRARERRKAQAAVDQSLAALSQLPSETNSVFGATGGQSVDTSNSSVIHTDFSQSGLSAIDADEGVDPVAEADVYMAYGRDAQAEEILLDALKVDPARMAIHLKLLEIYAQRKNAKQFETIASELYSKTSGRGADWDKAAAMGRKLDPENPLYHRAGEAAETATEPPREPNAAGAAMAAAMSAGTADKAPAPLANLDFTATAPGESDQAGLKDTWAMPRDLEAAGVDKTEPAGALDDASALDFDLDLDIGGAGEAATLDLDDAPEPAATAGDSGDLMLDLDLDQRADASFAPETAVPEAKVEELRPLTATALGGDIGAADDQGLDLDLSTTASESADKDTDSFDLAATLVGPEGLLVEEPPEPEQAPAAFDSALLDFELNLDGLSAPAKEAAAPNDLSSIDLDLEPFGVDEAGAAVAAVAAPAAASRAPTAAAPAERREEVDTKLELARAYEEMGDKEGARELLEEVLQEGDAAQQGSARNLMLRLA